MSRTNHSASSGENWFFLLLFLLLNQVRDGRRRNKILNVVGVPGSNGITDVEVEVGLILGKIIGFLPRKPVSAEDYGRDRERQSKSESVERETSRETVARFLLAHIDAN